MADDDTFDQLEDLVEPEALDACAGWSESVPVPVERVEAADEMGWESTVQPHGNTDGDVDDQFLLGHPLQQEAAWSEPLPVPLERVEAAGAMGLGGTVQPQVNTDGHDQFGHLVQQEYSALSEPVSVPLERVEAAGEMGWEGTVQLPADYLVQQDAARSEPVLVEAAQEAIQEMRKKSTGKKKEEGSGTRGSKRKRSPTGSTETASKEGWLWNTVGDPTFPAAEFRRLFGMSGSTLDHLCGRLADAVNKGSTERRPVTPVPVRKRVALCVWLLTSGESLRDVAHRFKPIALSTCHKIFNQVCAGIKAMDEVRWPNAAAIAANAAEFQGISGIRGVIGVVHTTHVSINAPKHDTMDYYNRHATARNNNRDSYSITLQASVNADGTFSDVFAGHPGGKSDEETLLASTLSTPESTGKILGQSMRLVGGAGYPLTEWMMVPYSDENLTPAQQSFNEGVEKVLAVGLDAFRRLKARWSLLQKRIQMKVEAGEKKNAADVDLASVLEVCCALHNICERLGDPLDPELLQGVELNDDGGGMVANDNPSPSASDLRDTLAHDLVTSMGTAAV